jgi:hypothetical protein
LKPVKNFSPEFMAFCGWKVQPAEAPPEFNVYRSKAWGVPLNLTSILFESPGMTCSAVAINRSATFSLRARKEVENSSKSKYDNRNIHNT